MYNKYFIRYNSCSKGKGNESLLSTPPLVFPICMSVTSCPVASAYMPELEKASCKVKIMNAQTAHFCFLGEFHLNFVAPVKALAGSAADKGTLAQAFFSLVPAQSRQSTSLEGGVKLLLDVRAKGEEAESEQQENRCMSCRAVSLMLRKVVRGISQFLHSWRVCQRHKPPNCSI